MTAKPLRADARRNRARVLEAAQEAFGSDGLSVPLDEIARRAGVGAGTVYRHFPTKEALFEAVLLTRMNELVEEAHELAKADDPGAAFFDFLALLIERSAAHKDLVDALASAGSQITESTSAPKRMLHDAGAELLENAQKDGAVRSDVGIGEVMALLTGATLAFQGNPTDDELPSRLFTVIRDGLRN